MAITTKMTEVQNGITFGYSDTCSTLFNNGNWKVSELARFSWCRWKDKYMGCMSSTDLNVTTPQGAAVESMVSYFQGDGARNKVKYVDNRITGEPYAFNILMYGRNGDLCLTSDNAANYRVVTSCSDFQKLYVQVDRYNAGNNRNIRFPVPRTIKENNLIWSSGGVYNTDTGSYTEWITVWTVIVIDENTFFVTRGMAFPNRTPCLYDGSIGNAQNNIRPSNAIEIHNDAASDTWYYSYSDITTYNKSKHLLRWYKNGLRITDTITFPSDYEDACWDVDDDVSIFLTGRATNSSRGNYTYTYYLRTENAVKNAIAYTGLRWKYAHGDTDHIYTPIINADGYITGYSTDPNAETKLKDIIDVTGNNINPLPPTPPSPSGDDPWHGIDFGGTGAGGGGAFCSVYYMTGAQLTSLKNWSNTSSPEGFDMLPSIIGLQQLPVAVTGVATTVKFLKSAAITQQGESRVVDTGVAAGTGTGQPVSFSLGSININRRMQQRGEPYLDYDCTIELFLPFAGTFVLDTQAVMGRTISAEIVVDPVNGTAFAYAWVSQDGQKMPIAYGGGSIAVDLPIASNQWGISRAAFKQVSHQATINAIKDIGNFMIGLGTFKTGQSGAIADRSGFASLSIQEGMQAKQIGSQMMTSSTINAATNTASSIVSATQLNNTNYTAVNGSFGGSYAEWSQPFTAYVRITRPKFKKPDNFNHTQAVPCVEAKKLSNCTGLTICVNPDCGSISCTEAEKLMITQALVGGVYAGGGQ